MKYTYFEKAIIAMVNELKELFKNYSYVSNIKRYQEFPVFIQSSGDETFMEVHSDRIAKSEKSDKMIIPALVLDFIGITFDEDNKTNEVNGNITLKHNGIESEYVGEVTHYPCEIRFDGTAIFGDIFQYMSFVEYLMNGVYKSRPFKFEYMGKMQDGIVVLETSDHDVEKNQTLSFGDIDEVGSHTETLSFNTKLQYPSFNLNSSLTDKVDSEGDGNIECGVGVPKDLQNSNNIIKGIIHYNNEEKFDNQISKDVTGKFPLDKQKI